MKDRLGGSECSALLTPHDTLSCVCGEDRRRKQQETHAEPCWSVQPESRALSPRIHLGDALSTARPLAQEKVLRIPEPRCGSSCVTASAALTALSPGT